MAKMTEAQKSAKWKKLAEGRVNKAITAIESLAKLSNKTRYSYTSGQVKIIEKAFQDALTDCFAAFEGKATRAGGIQL